VYLYFATRKNKNNLKQFCYGWKSMLAREGFIYLVVILAETELKAPP
jgi:hypothetical protein